MRYEIEWASPSPTMAQLDAVRLNEVERRQAKDMLSKAETIAELLYRLNADLNEVLQFVGRGIAVASRWYRPVRTRHLPR